MAGHLIECGPQGTGGNFTDWQDVPGWDDMGMPIVEVSEDGSLVMTRTPDTGGLVVPGSVGEQMLYEIGDPRAYLLPDVICDWSQVTLDQVGPDRVGQRRQGSRAYRQVQGVGDPCRWLARGFLPDPGGHRRAGQGQARGRGYRYPLPPDFP